MLRRMFPASPRHPLDERGLFLVQNPSLRARIMPLFSFDPRFPSERPIGHGTTFRIDPWGTCATAFHVIEDLLGVKGNTAALRDDIRLVALELEGIAMGRVPIPQDSWRPFEAMFSICAIERPPLQPPRVRNGTELSALSIARSGNVRGASPFLPMDLRRWRPTVGERIMALGFPDLDVDHSDAGDDRPFSQYIYGSEATIIEIQEADGGSGRPWPVFRVEANWPGGMSGGPVFNGAGHVIGIVSTGLVGVDVGTATYFSGWNMPEQTFRSIDPSNPGSVYGWGGFDASGRFVAFAGSQSDIIDAREEYEIEEIVAITSNPETGDYMHL